MKLVGFYQSSARSIILSILVLLLAGCDLLTNAKFMERFRRAPNPDASMVISEQGLGRLAKGDLLNSQRLFDSALQNNPRDVYALLGKGIILQQTGQYARAKRLFEAVLSLQPSASLKLMVMNNQRQHTVRELASMHIALLQNQGLSSSLREDEPDVSTQKLPGTSSSEKSKRHANMANKLYPKSRISAVSGSDKNILKRFEILKKLRDQGLMTAEEYDVRRKTNLGALLHLTQPPPAAGLERPVPSSDLILQRLHAIGKALELRAISVRQHGAERRTIVNGLMPSDPKSRAVPKSPPKGLLASADAIRRIEMLQENGLITIAEAMREKQEIEKSLTLATTSEPRKAVKQEQSKKPKASGPRPAVHIASFRSKKAADRGWAQLRRAHRALIGKLTPEISKVNLGGKKGVFYRLVVGPLASNSEAVTICRKLKRRRQYCEPAFMAGG